jgi:hypothetical protein
MKIDKYLDLIKKDQLSHKEINSLLDFINLSSKDQVDDLVNKFNARLKSDPIQLDNDHFKKAEKYLVSKHMTKHGILHDNTPFKTTLQIMVVANLSDIEVVKIVDAGTIFKKHYIPQYKAIYLDEIYFEYFVFNNEIQILKK